MATSGDLKLAIDMARIDAEQRFRLAFEDNMAPMIFTDLEDTIFAANDAFCHLIGYSREEILGHGSKQFTHREDVGITEETHRRIIHGEELEARYIKRYQHKSGRTIIVEVSKSPARNDVGETLYFVVSEREITDRVRRDLILELLSEVNRFAMMSTSEDAILRQVCEILINRGGFAYAFISAEDGDGGTGSEIVCSSGDSTYSSDVMRHRLGPVENGHDPTSATGQTRVTRVVNDFRPMTAPDSEPARDSDMALRSAVAVPFSPGNREGTLSVYSGEVLAFDELIVRGLEDIARATEFAISHVRSVQSTERALEATNALVETLSTMEIDRAETERRFRFAFEDNMAPMVFSDHDDLAIAVNDAFCEMVGFSREELMGQDSKQFTFPGDIGVTEGTHRRFASGELDQIRYEKRYLRKDGHIIIAEVARSVSRDSNGEVLYSLSSERDVTEERLLTSQLAHQALHDPLTGLANRVLFEDRLKQAHSRLLREGGLGAVLLLDLDDFKGVNDTYGHLVGDQLLVGVARRLEMVTRQTDTLCRLGGDEFLYLAEGLVSVEEAEEVTNRLLEVLTEPFLINSIRIEQHASVGLVVCDGARSNCEESVQEADIALYEAKRLRRGRHVRFESKMSKKAVGRFSLAQELRHALNVGDVSMHYQPIVDLGSTEIVGFESLMRWHHPEQGFIPPDVFIPLAEQSDLIMDLGALAMREAVQAASSWENSGTSAGAPYVTVNLSSHQLRDPGLIPKIEDALRDSGVSPERLIVEITESVALLEVRETMKNLSQLEEIGVRIALDDFGTGYSSLSYIALLLPKIIKIDRSFINPAHQSHHSFSLLETIVSLGRNLNLTVLAEGIETREQFNHLRDLGCQLGQGYLFSPAVPAAEVANLVSEGQRSWKSLRVRPEWNFSSE